LKAQSHGKRGEDGPCDCGKSDGVFHVRLSFLCDAASAPSF
jgi:hypothetical protein